MGGLTTAIPKTLDDWLSHQQTLHPKNIDLGLERIQTVYRRLFPSGVAFKVITVAGTNGKGSTVGYLENIYKQSPYKVGSFTSPHLLSYNERFKINTKPVDDTDICQAFETIETARGKTSLTYFEFSTLAALLIFASKKVQVAILEVGLGGRLDSVNVVEPDLSIITSIDIDHSEYLGDTREKIALEKAGIMRTNKPCVCADPNPPRSLIDHAKKLSTKFFLINKKDFPQGVTDNPIQQQNMAMALRAVALMHAYFPISEDKALAAVQKTKLAGRQQVLRYKDKTFILDVAHNPAAVRALNQSILKSKEPTIAIFSALGDKDITNMIDAISAQIDLWLLIPLEVERGLTKKQLTDYFDCHSNVNICKNAQMAFKTALENKNAKRIVVFGSFHTVALVSEILNKLSKP